MLLNILSVYIVINLNDFCCRETQDLTTWESLLEEAGSIDAHLPSKTAVKEIIKKAKDWLSKAESVFQVLKTTIVKSHYCWVTL